jgi:hypothetical protein
MRIRSGGVTPPIRKLASLSHVMARVEPSRPVPVDDVVTLASIQSNTTGGSQHSSLDESFSYLIFKAYNPYVSLWLIFLMSSTPHSPPETPFKGTMAVDNEKLVSTPPRTRLPDAPPNGILKQAPVPSELETEKDPGAEVQVPSTAPSNKSLATSKSQEVHAQVEDKAEKPQEAFDEELDPFNWEGLQFRYNKALQEINDRDDKIIDQVDRFSQVSLQISSYFYLDCIDSD